MERAVNECLQSAEVQMSHSSIFLDPLYPFPEIDARALEADEKQTEPVAVTAAAAAAHCTPSATDNDAVWSYLTAYRQATGEYCHRPKPLAYVRRQLLAADDDDNDDCDAHRGHFNFANFKPDRNDDLNEAVFVALNASSVRTLIFDSVDLLAANMLRHLDAFLTNSAGLHPIKLSLRSCFGSGSGAGSEALATFLDCNWPKWPVRSLDLSANAFGSDSNLFLFRSLIAKLAGNQTLAELNLAWNQLEASAAADLNCFLAEAVALEHLNLCGNRLNSAQCLRTVFRAIPDSLSILRELNLKLNGLRSADSLRPLVGFVTRSQHLHALDLSFNFLAGDSATLLANCFRKHQHLREIQLSGNLFDPSSVETLLRHLAHTRLAAGLPRTIRLDNCYVSATFEPTLAKIDRQQPIANRYRIEGILVSETASIRTPTARDLKPVLVKRIRFLSKPKSSQFAQLFTKLERKLQAKAAKNQHLPSSATVSLPRADFDAVLAKSKAARRWKLDTALVDQVFEAWPAATGPESLHLSEFLRDFLATRAE